MAFTATENTNNSTFEQDTVMRQAARQPTLSRVAETRQVLGKHKTESGKKKARKPSNPRQEQEKWHQMKKSFSLGETQAESPSGWSVKFIWGELSPIAASNEDLKKLPVLCCVYSNNESLEEGVRNI